MGTVLKERTYALKKVHIPVLEEHLKKRTIQYMSSTYTWFLSIKQVHSHVTLKVKIQILTYLSEKGGKNMSSQVLKMEYFQYLCPYFKKY